MHPGEVRLRDEFHPALAFREWDEVGLVAREAGRNSRNSTAARRGAETGFHASEYGVSRGTNVCYIYAASSDAGEYRIPSLPRCPTVVIPKPKVGWHFYSWADGKLESFVSSYLREHRVDEPIATYEYTDYTGLKDAEGIEADRTATDRVSALMRKLLVVLNTRLSLVELGRCERPQRIKRGRIKHRELWSPNLIGWRYRPARSLEGTQGTHASPRMHWRRGHIRNQPHGPRRSERKLI